MKRASSSGGQPSPECSRADVEHIVRRDYPADQFKDIMALLGAYGSKDWQLERDRVQLAALKLAAGKLEALRKEIENARCDFRDVLSPAEYPAYGKKRFRIDKLAPEERQRIIEADWKQYEDWFYR